MGKRTSHTRKESRLAVYRVLLDVYQIKSRGGRVKLANLCAAYHCGNINGKIIDAMDWNNMPVYEDAIIVLKANSDYKRSCNHGTRMTASQAIAGAKQETIETTVGEIIEASKIAQSVTQAEKKDESPKYDLVPDSNSLFPDQSLIPKAIRICQAAGYIVSRPL